MACWLKYFIYAVYFLTSMELKADTLGVYITGGVWLPDFSGNVIDTASVTNSINFKDDLNIKNTVQNFFYINIEQPVSAIPNVRFGRTIIKTSGNNTLTKTISFQGDSYSSNEKIITKLNLEHIEAALYWKAFDQYNSLDLGFAVKEFAGEVSLRSEISGTATLQLNATIPLLYVGYKVALPLTALTVGFNSSFLVINSTYLSDVLVFVRYQTDALIGIEAGYRNFQLGINTSAIKTDIKITGLYINALIYY